MLLICQNNNFGHHIIVGNAKKGLNFSVHRLLVANSYGSKATTTTRVDVEIIILRGAACFFLILWKVLATNSSRCNHLDVHPAWQFKRLQCLTVLSAPVLRFYNEQLLGLTFNASSMASAFDLCYSMSACTATIPLVPRFS